MTDAAISILDLARKVADSFPFVSSIHVEERRGVIRLSVHARRGDVARTQEASWSANVLHAAPPEAIRRQVVAAFEDVTREPPSDHDFYTPGDGTHWCRKCNCRMDEVDADGPCPPPFGSGRPPGGHGVDTSETP